MISQYMFPTVDRQAPDHPAHRCDDVRRKLSKFHATRKGSPSITGCAVDTTVYRQALAGDTRRGPLSEYCMLLIWPNACNKYLDMGI